MSGTAWVVAGILALAVAGFFLAWRRALAATADAELASAEAARVGRAAQAAAHREAAQLAALLDAHADPVFVLAPDHTILRANPAARALFPQIEQSLISATRSAELDELVAHTLAGGEDRDRQVVLNGQPFRARAVPADEFGVVLTLQDVSALQRLGRARRDFIANISHELRTPLTSIRLLLEGLAVTPSPSALEKIGAEVHALEQMAQELLDLAQIESGQALVRLVPVPASELVMAAVERLRPQAEHKQQTMSVDVTAELTALADAEQLQRALGNLLHNAIKFTPPGGGIRVRAFPRSDEIVFEVADSGPGIQPEDLPRVFERFFRGDRSRGWGGGTGLGLAIAKHVVEAHGGQIWAESDGRPGHGALFRFTLLAAQ